MCWCQEVWSSLRKKLLNKRRCARKYVLVSIGGSKGRIPSSGSIFFEFHTALRKIWLKNSLTPPPWGLALPVWVILYPPLVRWLVVAEGDRLLAVVTSVFQWLVNPVGLSWSLLPDEWRSPDTRSPNGVRTDRYRISSYFCPVTRSIQETIPFLSSHHEVRESDSLAYSTVLSRCFWITEIWTMWSVNTCRFQACIKQPLLATIYLKRIPVISTLSGDKRLLCSYLLPG